MHACRHVCMYACTYGRMDVWMDGWIWMVVLSVVVFQVSVKVCKKHFWCQDALARPVDFCTLQVHFWLFTYLSQMEPISVFVSTSDIVTIENTGSLLQLQAKPGTNSIMAERSSCVIVFVEWLLDCKVTSERLLTALSSPIFGQVHDGLKAAWEELAQEAINIINGTHDAT